MTRIITLDGPAASGKTSVSRRLAALHGWSWVSTGAFYRGLARVARFEKVSTSDESKLVQLALDPKWSVILDSEHTKVFYQQQDITAQIGTEQTGQDASILSRLSGVRTALLSPQRACAENVSVLIAEGRDCGTVVFPQAELKFYLTATASDRAERRALQTGLKVTDVHRAQSQRDDRDTERSVAPLQIPSDAHVIDTTGLNFEHVVKVVDAFVVKHFRL